MLFFRVSVCQEFVRTIPPKLLNRFQRDFACIIIGWGSCAPGVTFDLDLLFKVTGCHFVVHTYSFIYFPGMRPSAPILCLSVYIETLYHIYSGFWSKTILTFLTNVFNYTPTQFNCPAFIGIAIFNCGPWLIFMYTFGTKHKLDYAIAGVFITFSDSSSFV